MKTILWRCDYGDVKAIRCELSETGKKCFIVLKNEETVPAKEGAVYSQLQQLKDCLSAS